MMKARFRDSIVAKSLQNIHRINIRREGITDISSTAIMIKVGTLGILIIAH